MKFIVNVIMETWLSLEVEAETEEEAYKIGKDTDGGEYVESGAGNWEITSVEKL